MIVSYNEPMTASKPPAARPGRPREFDVNDALDGAVRVFRERGYHATSVSDLGAAMNLTPGSIYKAFADKRAVYIATLDRYSAQRRQCMMLVLDALDNGREKIHAMLRFYADAAHGEEGRMGCLVVGGMVEMSTFDPELAAHVSGALQRTEDLLRALLADGVADGSIPASLDQDGATLALLSVLEGLRVVGKSGRNQAQMLAAADAAVRLLG